MHGATLPQGMRPGRWRGERSCVADTYGTAEDTTLTVTAPGVLGNDSDPDSDRVAGAVVGTAPGHATSFTLNPDGSFSYTPAADYHGPDFFTYTASDGQSASAPVTVGLHRHCGQ